MSLFSQRKPRKFSHSYIYVDERADRLREIEERAKLDLGMETSFGYRPDSLRGAFSAGRDSRNRRGFGHGATVSLPMIATIILLLLLIGYCLLA